MVTTNVAVDIPTAHPTGRKLVGAKGFKRNNPRTDKFPIHRFHHFEFFCGDASNTARRFGLGLGLTQVARSDQGTGNYRFASHVMRSDEVVFAFTAPYGAWSVEHAGAEGATTAPTAQPWFDAEAAHGFMRAHGLAVRAVGLVVGDAAEAFRVSTAGGAVAVTPPCEQRDGHGTLVVSEVKLYGDVVLRFMSGDYAGPFMPGYEAELAPRGRSYGLRRVDHAVGNVPDLLAQIDVMVNALGLHEFAEFTAEDVGTIDSGLNSMVLASNNEMVLLPVNEPTTGTRRKSQIQTYLEQNGGAGLQHLAIKTDDIFTTLRAMRAASELGAGFDFMPRPSDGYYAELPAKIGDSLTPEQYAQVEELGVLVDKDDQGVLLQLFTKPLGDRPTIFIEVIQRLCALPAPEHAAEEAAAAAVLPALLSGAADVEVGGCGGFGKGNFSELFKSIEVYETDLGIN